MKLDWNNSANTVDIKSMVIGMLFAALILFSFGAYDHDSGSEFGEVIGPFQISSGGAGNVFILDTRTGHMWQIDSYDYIDMGTPANPAYKKSRID